MTIAPPTNTQDKTAELIEMARCGHQFHRHGCLIVAGWRSQLETLMGKWPDSNSTMTAVSLVFTDAPYELSDPVIDAVVIFQDGAFKRVVREDLPTQFQWNVLRGFSSKVGDALIVMDRWYQHQLLVGQGYLTLETLTVMNIDGNCRAVHPALSASLPYTVTGTLGDSATIKERCPDWDQPEGLEAFLSWTTCRQQESRACKSRISDDLKRYGQPELEVRGDDSKMLASWINKIRPTGA